ncbi:MAG: 5-oxoprolinase subunit PxpA [Fulvivirga sp.]
MSGIKIDINCDMGESYGRFKIGNDAEIFPFISSCNIACGFHGGDPLHIEDTIKQALKYKVAIGAHPSYPDLAGFGRRQMHLGNDELKALIKYQVSALKGMTESLGGKLTYVKPHGALYNSAAENIEEAQAICESIKELDSSLMLMGLTGSPIETVAKDHDISFIKEAFADRRYTPNGRLMSRSLEGSVIDNPEDAAKQVLDICINNKVCSSNGSWVPLKADSVCIHGDNSNAVEILKAIRKMAEEEQILIESIATK